MRWKCGCQERGQLNSSHIYVCPYACPYVLDPRFKPLTNWSNLWGSKDVESGRCCEVEMAVCQLLVLWGQLSL